MCPSEVKQKVRSEAHNARLACPQYTNLRSAHVLLCKRNFSKSCKQNLFLPLASFDEADIYRPVLPLSLLLQGSQIPQIPLHLAGDPPATRLHFFTKTFLPEKIRLSYSRVSACILSSKSSEYLMTCFKVDGQEIDIVLFGNKAMLD